jgi:hypothetical protein
LNPRQTWILVALAGGLFAYILLFEWRGSPENAAPPAHLFPRLQPDQISRVEFAFSNQVVRAEHSGDGWLLTSPIRYPALPAAIERLVKNGSELRPRSVIPAREITSLKDFDLEPPKARLTIYHGSTSTELRIGKPTPSAEGLYTQIAGQRTINVMDISILGMFPWTPDLWRDRSIFDLGSTNFDRLKLRIGPNDLVFQRENTNRDWRITIPKPDKRVNEARFELLLDQLRHWAVTQFVSEDPRVDLDQYGLQTPESELTFGLGTNDLATVQFGKPHADDPGMVYARCLAHTNIVAVPRELVDRLHEPHWDFRDHHLVDAIPSANISRIEVRSGDSTFALKRGDLGAWQLAGPPTAPADRELVQEMIGRLENMQALREEKDVVTDFGQYGLATPELSYTLIQTASVPGVGTTNLVLGRLDFGGILRPQPDQIYVRREGESSVYVAELHDCKELPYAPWQLRDRRIWNLSSTNVLGVTVERKGKVKRFARTGPRKWTAGNEVLDDARSAAFDEAVERLGRLQATRWIKGGKAAYQAPVYGIADAAQSVTVEIAGADKPRTLRIDLGRAPQKSDPYAATVDEGGEPVIFEIPAQFYKEVILQYLTP